MKPNELKNIVEPISLADERRRRSGTMFRVAPHKEYDALNEAAHLLRVDAQKHGHQAISDANDNSTHDAVLRAFRRAYRAAKEAEEGK